MVLENGGESIAIGFTDRKLSPHAGSVVFWKFLHPLLAVLEEAKLVAGFWLRPGNTSCANNIAAFTLEVLGRLPKWLKVRVVRADSGFCENSWLDLLERQRLCYIVVARLMSPLRKLKVRGASWWCDMRSRRRNGLVASSCWRFPATCSRHW
jgi:hypothetical protein